MAETPKRCAVVTGANKGIGLEICRQLASNGIAVVLTARDENKGLEAIKSLKDSGFSDGLLVFHQLDVVDQTSISSLADFVKSRFGKLDILVNNAGISGAVIDHHSLKTAVEICGRWLPTSSSTMAEASKRCAVVTGANRGIGFEICRQLASNGVVVVLTARDENKGLEAIKNLKDSGISDHLLVFHQLDVLDHTSVASLAEFVKTQFGKVDILVNNAGVLGASVDPQLLRRAIELCGSWPNAKQANWKEISTETLEMAEVCFETNYYGTKRMVEAFAPLLRLSDSPRIVNVSSSVGLLKNIANGWAKGLLSDAEGLSEERIEEVVDKFMKDFKNGLLETKGWPAYFSAYFIAKAAMNAYTRILAKTYPNFIVNALCPGYCRTDITTNLGPLSSAEGAENVVRLALLPKEDAPSGCFFIQKQMVDF